MLGPDGGSVGGKRDIVKNAPVASTESHARGNEKEVATSGSQVMQGAAQDAS